MPPISGNTRRIASNTGSVMRHTNCTSGLYGLGLNHDIIARARMTYPYKFKTKINVFITPTLHEIGKHFFDCPIKYRIAPEKQSLSQKNPVHMVSVFGKQFLLSIFSSLLDAFCVFGYLFANIKSGLSCDLCLLPPSR